MNKYVLHKVINCHHFW